MKQGFWFLCAIIVAALIGGSLASVSAQVSSPTPDPFAVQLTSSPTSTFSSLTGDITANGRFVVFTSNGDVATQNKRNADGNREIFLADYAQRRIFQITDTRSVPNPTPSPSPTPTPSPSPSPTASPSPTPTPQPVPEDRTQLLIEVDNRAPMISLEPVLDGGVRNYIIVFSTNAPNPSSPTGTDDATWRTDANSEIWIYKVPAVPDVDLTLGTDIPLIPLDAGTFHFVTKTAASRAPTAGSTTASPFFADDNRDATISDDGRVIAFISTRNPRGITGNADANPELFLFTINDASTTSLTELGGAIRQVTDTKDAVAGIGFIFQSNPSLSFDGSRVAFVSSAGNFAMSTNTPTPNLNNTDTNAEVFYADVGGSIVFHQVTRTLNNITTANLLSPGRRLSRDGKLITFESKATDPKSNAAPTTQLFGVFVYTIDGDTFNEVGTRNTSVGDVIRFPTFTDYDGALSPSALIFTSFLNFRPDGSIPTTAQASEGLNADNSAELFLTQVPVSSSNTFVRLTNLTGLTGGTRGMASASHKRITFSMGGVEVGGGNIDGSTEVFYLLTPVITTQSAAALSFFTGGSEMPVAAATPLPSPTPTPTPTPTPVPGQPFAVAPGELTIVRSSVALAPSDADTTGDVNETRRSPALPVELNGVSVSVNGHAAGLYRVRNAEKQINFVVPIGTAVGLSTVAINILNTGANTDTLLRGLLQITAAQPDIFTFPGNRAAALTNPGHVAEPFNVTTGANPTVISLMVTGVRFATAGEITVTVGTTAITGTGIVSVQPNPNMPGNDIIDFALPASLAGAGDVPVQVTVNKTTTGTTVSRPADTAPRITIN